jgi:hypothetical protein
LTSHIISIILIVKGEREMNRVKVCLTSSRCPFCGADVKKAPCGHFVELKYNMFYDFEGDRELLPPSFFPPVPPIPKVREEVREPESIEVLVLHFHSEGHVSMKALGSKNPSSGDWVCDKYFVATQEGAEFFEAPAFSFKERLLEGLRLIGEEPDEERVEAWLSLGEEGYLTDEEDEQLRKLAALAAQKLGLKILPVFERVEKEPEGWVELAFRPEKKLIKK